MPCRRIKNLNIRTRTGVLSGLICCLDTLTNREVLGVSEEVVSPRHGWTRFLPSTSTPPTKVFHTPRQTTPGTSRTCPYPPPLIGPETHLRSTGGRPADTWEGERDPPPAKETSRGHWTERGPTKDYRTTVVHPIPAERVSPRRSTPSGKTWSIPYRTTRELNFPSW